MTSKHIILPVSLHEGRGDWRGAMGHWLRPQTSPVMGLDENGKQGKRRRIDEMMR